MRSAARVILAAELLVVLGRGAGAQELRGRVLDSATNSPISGVVLVVVDSAGSVLARNIANARGQYRIAVAPRARRLRALRIGFRLRDMRIPSRTGGITTLDVVMVSIPPLLEPMRATAASRCPIRADAAAAFSLLEQARAGLLATIVAREANPAALKLLSFQRVMDRNSDRIERQKVQIDSGGRRLVSFAAAGNAADFVELGFARDSASVRIFYGPDAETLLDDSFLLGYCIRIQEPQRDRPNEVGLGFAAADRKGGRIDIDGALWIDTVARALRDFDFRFEGVERGLGAPEPRGRIWFREMPNGVVLIDKWYFRLIEAMPDSTYGRNGVLIVRHRYHGREVGGEVARAIWPDGQAWKASLGAARIHVVDQTGRPATGLIVRFAGTDYLASPDAQGDLEIPDLLPGPYSAVVMDSTLASTGIVLGTPLRIFAQRDSMVQATLVAPSPQQFQRKACDTDRSALWVTIHIVRDRQAVDAASWQIGQDLGTPNEVVAASGRTGADGVFGFCDRRTAGEVVQIRARGASERDQSVTMLVKIRVKELAIELPPTP